jgi:hypothetical protein
MKIIHEVAKGRIVHFYNCGINDPYLVRYLEKTLYTYYSKRENNYYTPDIDKIKNEDLSVILPTDIYAHIKYILEETENIKPEDFRNILSTEQVTVTQLRIFQSYIIYRLYRDPVIRDKCLQGKKYLSLAKIANEYLDIKSSTCKMLLRISGNLKYLPKLYEAGIDVFTERSLDKIANFGLAVKNYGLPKAIEAFRCCNVREFRCFIKTGLLPVDLILSGKPIPDKIYERAKPFLAIYNKIHNNEKTGHPLYLYSFADVKLIDKFKTKYLKKKKEREKKNKMSKDSIEVDSFLSLYLKINTVTSKLNFLSY